MRRIALLLLATACATPPPAASPAPAASQPAETPGMTSTETCPAEYNAAQRCMARIEERRMAAAGGAVSRVADTLVIRGTNGNRLALENDTTAGNGTRVYRYDRFLPEIGFHLVELSFYEGGSYVLVDARTTDQTMVIAPPVVSPGRTRFAAAMVDLWAGYDYNGIQVWRLGEGGPRLEWEIGGGDQWGASGIAWASEEALDFNRHERTRAPATELTSRRMRLSVAGGALSITPAPR